ncbi:HprK-related kinase A [Alteromonas sp. Cnat3-28]|uniref:HprK-related kinase A n=1 Tax=Alteromonas sp. Cnat3-28 TaxID=2917729 RepID=UPI001EF67255|nr:HprK-related kinase A [Alteromonas sp. Cnat3-28]MCG7644879.1 HprK-related kinase A [Alteromonas sp. Cnat3-28]
MLNSSTIVVDTYPFSFKVSSDFSFVLDNLSSIYYAPLLSESAYANFNVSISYPRIFGFPLLNRALFNLDGFSPFTRGSKVHSCALLEWGMNWCVSQYATDRLVIHAACVARDERGVILSGDSGSGKSTLSCALMHNSYRLLTDELTLINLSDNLVTPFVRPVSLKNGAIDVIKNLYPESLLGKVSKNTHKGTVGHCRPTDESWSNMRENAFIGNILFPKFDSTCESPSIRIVEPLEALSRLVEQSFNIHILGAQAISCLQHICENAPAYEIRYSRTEDAIEFVNSLYE